MNMADCEKTVQNSERLLPNTKEEETEDENETNVESQSCWKRIPGFGLMLVIVKNLIHGASDVVVKKIEGIDPFSLIFYRSLIMLCLFIPWGVIQDKPPFPPNLSRTDRVWQVLRCFLTLANTVGSYFALQQMPISIQKMILSSSPIFTVVFARIFLKEHFGIVEVIVMLLMSSGLILVIQPSFIFHKELPEESFKEHYLLACIILIVTTFLNSSGPILVRKLRKLHVASLSSTREIIFIMILFIIIFAANIDLKIQNPTDKLKLVFFGCCCTMQVILNIFSLKLENAGTVTLLDRSSAIVVAVITQIVIFNEIPNNLAFGGLALVSLAVLLQGSKCLNFKSFQKLSTNNT